MKYKLYRTVKEILHPTISKRNISNYRIILKDDLLPVQIFYPKKVSNINQVIICIHGDENITECTDKYKEIYINFALDTNCLVIAIDYDEIEGQYKEMVSKIQETVKYLYKGLEECEINPNKIILMGDSTGGNIITCINHLKENDWKIEKEILFYPVLSLEYFGKTNYLSITQNENLNFQLIPSLAKYYSSKLSKKELKEEWFLPLKREDKIPKTLLFTGSVDCLKDEIKEYHTKYPEKTSYLEVPFLSHGFLKRLDKEEEKMILENMKKFIEE